MNDPGRGAGACLLVGTDGRVQQRLVTPATGAFGTREAHHPVRWFARDEDAGRPA
jgi:hypothetical protein